MFHGNRLISQFLLGTKTSYGFGFSIKGLAKRVLQAFLRIKKVPKSQRFRLKYF